MKIIYIYILASLIYSNNFMPLNNASVNYTHVFFKWPQITNIEYYVLYIQNYETNENYQVNVNINSIIIDDFLTWDSEYSWYVCGLNNENLIIDCFNQQYFNINPLPSYFPDNIEILYDSESYYPGVTLLDFDSNNFSSAIDRQGEPVWFVDKYSFNSRILVTDILDSGNLLGIGLGKGYEFDIDGNIIFQTPENIGVHHDFISKNNNYLFIDAVIENYPCPDNCPENLPDTIEWKGDRFIEMNSMGEILWEWNTFDYLSLEEYNPLYINRLSNSYPVMTTFDWTHSNSIYYDSWDNSIYLSIRNLSRILKVDYLSRDVIWQIGDTTFMDEIDFYETLNFSGQHSVQMAGDNILFFDNHSDLNPEISRCIEFNINDSLQTPSLIWDYSIFDSLYTGSRGECDRLDNHNTLISVGRTGNVIEVNNNNELVWRFKVKDNGNDVTIYRSKRIKNLYPQAFSVIINNLSGDIYNGYLYNDLDTLVCKVYNQGWVDQLYHISLVDMDNNTLFEEATYVSAESEILQEISLTNLLFNEAYILKIYPYSNIEAEHTIEFLYNYNIFGDLNVDGNVDVLDIITLINTILENEEYYEFYDLNNDEIVNIIDIIVLVNLILPNE